MIHRIMKVSNEGLYKHMHLFIYFACMPSISQDITIKRLWICHTARRDDNTRIALTWAPEVNSKRGRPTSTRKRIIEVHDLTGMEFFDGI